MDQFDYRCAEHGIVESVLRNEISSADPPTLCPRCGSSLRVEVRHDI